MANYAKLAATTQSLIQKNGRVLTLVRLDTALSDVDKPWRGTASPRTEPDQVVELRGVFVDPASLMRYGLQADSDEFQKRSSQFVFIAAADLGSSNINDFNEIRDQSLTWRIQEIRTLAPGDTPLLHAIGVRR